MALPTNLFDENWYLARNPDVAEAIEAGLISSAFEHFNLYGKFEGRAPGPLFNQADYLAANRDVAEAVRAGLINAYDHFLQYGASENRSPLSLFDPEFYLSQNPDVAAAVEAGLISATEHFLLYGQGEPRQINPFINLGAYLQANSDVAEAADRGAISPLMHLLTHGAAEGRDLGNGINLGIFANDLKFQEAVQSGNLQAALERVEEVAPFLPTFEPPAGWEPPADTPIPTDFTPPEGTKLVIPPSVVVPDDVELPEDVFEPVEPGPQPEPEDPGPVDPEPEDPGPVDPEPEDPGPVDPEPEDPGPVDPKPTTFIAKLDEETGVLTFSGSARGDITVEIIDGTAIFERGKKFADPVNLSEIKQVSLKATETLVLTPDQVKNHAVTTAGDGKVKIKFASTSEGQTDRLEAHKDTNIEHLALDVNNADVSLVFDKDKNPLVYSKNYEGEKSLKKLSIDASGTNFIDLGNDHKISTDQGIGYFLGEVKVAGTGGSDYLFLKNLYFGKENTKFDSTGFGGDVVLNAYIYNGKDQKDVSQQEGYKWTINFGGGDDTLILNGAWSGNFPGKYGSWIDGGDGHNILALLPNEVPGQPDVYDQWANPDMTWVPGDFKVPVGEYADKPIVSNFQTLATNAVQGRSYKSKLLGNKFENIMLYSDGDSNAEVTIEHGYKGVTIDGSMKVDATALKGSEASINITSFRRTEEDAPENVHVKIANLNEEENNKSDLDGDRKSDMTINIWDLEAFVGGTISIENMTISATSKYTHAPITNDVIYLNGLPVDDKDLVDHVKTFTVTKGANRPNGDWYVNFTLEIDLDGDFTTNDVVEFSLENIVARGVFNTMLQALDTVNAYGTLENTKQLAESDVGLVESGNLYTSYGLTKNPSNWTEHKFESGVGPGGDALIGLVGILVDEGTLAAEVPDFL